MPTKPSTQRPPVELNYLSREQAAKQLGVSPQTIDKHIRTGALPVHRLGRRVLIRPSDIVRLIEGE